MFLRSFNGTNILRPTPELMRGLVGWWRFDDGAAQDFSGFGNHGTLVGSPKTAEGRVRQGILPPTGMKFVRASSQHITVPDAASLRFSNDGTVSAWVKFASVPTSGTPTQMYGIINKQTTSTKEWGLRYSNYTGQPTQWNFYGASNVAYSNTPTVGIWYHVCGTNIGGAGTLYINGVSVATGSPAIVTGTNTVNIGEDFSGNGRFFDGVIDDIRVYNRGLSPGEVFALYASAFQQPFLNPIQILGPSTYNDSLTESGSASDAPSGLLVAVGSLTESGSAADTPSGLIVASPSLTESGSAADTPSGLLVAVGSLTESGSAADTPSGLLVAVASLTEAASANSTQTAGYFDTLIESAPISDTPSSSAAFVGSSSESVSATDSPSALAIFVAAVTNSEIIISSESAQGAFAGTFTESVAISESLGNSAVFAVSVTETANASDLPAVLLPHTTIKLKGSVTSLIQLKGRM